MVHLFLSLQKMNRSIPSECHQAAVTVILPESYWPGISRGHREAVQLSRVINKPTSDKK